MNYIIGIIFIVIGIMSIKKIDNYINEDRENRSFKNSKTNKIVMLGLIPFFAAVVGAMLLFVGDLRLFEQGWGLIVASIILIIFGLYQAVLNFKAAKKAKKENTNLDVIKFNYFTRQTVSVSLYETNLTWGLAWAVFAELLVIRSIDQPSVLAMVRIPLVIIIILNFLAAAYLPNYITRWFANKAVGKGGFNHEK
ncbi:hypothetical protein Q2T76_01995 [Lactobacillus sp. YT155]|uniref:hypothetical protein n=1 Tax=Lactobacillus sp. YT155 TaxID=3060955 RepID=UPI00265E9083|nr:hypothetical protein [Lactobacillus sp. YT155]MDO1604821.1 hypothetical protein [Lactobacillus sp. YT155]